MVTRVVAKPFQHMQLFIIAGDTSDVMIRIIINSTELLKYHSTINVLKFKMNKMAAKGNEITNEYSAEITSHLFNGPSRQTNATNT